MKICLVNPTLAEDKGLQPPLGLCSIAAMLLKQGHEVRILDREVLKRKHGFKELNKKSREFLKEFCPDAVGIGATTPLVPDAYGSIKLARELFPKIPTVMGGVHATILPKETLKECPELDIVVRGEGEVTMSELAEKNFSNLKSILGITYRKKRKIRSNADRPLVQNLDEIPIPARHLLDMGYYLKPSGFVIYGIELKVTHIFSARGCPYNCNFCCGNLFFGRRMRTHSVRRIVEEVEQLIKDYKIDGLFFADDVFFLDKSRTRKLCREFIKRKINKKVVWQANMRVNNADLPIFKLMKKAGCAVVSFGFESNSPRMLKLLNKLSTPEMNYNAARITKKAGLRLGANIMANLWQETEEDMDLTMKFLMDTKPEYTVYYKLCMFPGSYFYNKFKNKYNLGRFKWDEYDTNLKTGKKETNFTSMSDKMFFEKYSRTFRYIQRNNSLNFISYNMAHHPIRLIRRLFLTFKENPGFMAGKIRVLLGGNPKE